MKLRKSTPKDENRREFASNNLRAERYRYHTSRQEAEAVSRNNSGASEHKQVLRQITGLLLLAALILCVVYGLWLDTTPSIKVSGATDTLLRDEAVYQAGAADLLDNSLLNRSKLTINTNKVAEELKARFPEIAEVVVIIPLASHEPIVDLRPKEPTLIINAQNGAFVVDETGKALMKVGDLENPQNYTLPTVIDQSGLEVSSGTQVITANTVAFIKGLLHQFEQANQRVDRIILPTAPNELRLSPAAADYFVKFDITRDPRIQAGALFAVQDSLSAQSVTPTEYIDVRVAEKAYYK